MIIVGEGGRPTYDPIMILKILFDKINYSIKKNKCITGSGSIIEILFNTIVKKKMTNLKISSKLVQKDIQAGFTKKHNIPIAKSIFLFC